MIRIIWIFLAALFLTPALSQAGIIGPASIRYVDGDVMFQTPDNDEWLPTAINTPLDEGDALWCPEDSRAEIQLPDGTIVRLDGGSQLDLLANEDGFIHLHLASGRLYMKTSQSSGSDALQIDADDTTVVPAARTRLRIDMLPNNQEDVSIFKGTAYVEGNGSRTKVRAGEHIALEEGRSELLPLNPADNWEYWNVERDRNQSRSARSESFLPDELRGHTADLDTNGTWVRDPEYGMVWRPTVILSDDWAPYRSGRWIWKGDDYVWVSFESWGWVPYHYGRWAVISGVGWCWVPPARGDVYWGPGYVGWYTTGSQVGWTPLAPGEIFYGRRNYGRHSAIISNVRIDNSTVVYRNRRNPGGLTVLPQRDFLRGRTVIQQPTRNASVLLSVSVGSPRIKPVRETRMPIIRQTPPRATPPRIERRDKRELRERFPRVIPDATPQRRRQAAPVATPAPLAPARQTPAVREKRTVYPTVTPNANETGPGRTPQGATPKRDENRQRPTTVQPAPTPAPQPAPAVSAPASQRPERTRREDTPVIAPAAQPQPQAPRREERRQRPVTPPAAPAPVPAAAPGPVPQHTEQPKRLTTPDAAPQRRERAPTENRQKKVWQVTTPETSNDKDSKEKEHKERDRERR